MSTGIVLLSHGGIAAALHSEAQRILPQGGGTRVIGVAADESCSSMRGRLEYAISQVDGGDGVLILTDLEGATPCNQVTQLLAHPDYHHRVRLVTGLNLPMLLKVLSYRDQPLSQLAELAVAGGTTGIHQAEQ